MDKKYIRQVSNLGKVFAVSILLIALFSSFRGAYKETINIDGSVVYMSKDRLLHDSQLVVKATVKEIEPAKMATVENTKADDFRNIKTDVIFNVEKIYKGELKNNEIRIRFNHGEYKNLILKYSGYPDPYVGQEVIMCLKKDNTPYEDVSTDNTFYLAGALQGYFKPQINDDKGLEFKNVNQNLVALNDLQTEVINSTQHFNEKILTQEEIAAANEKVFGK